MTLWEVDIYPADGQPDIIGDAVSQDARDLGLSDSVRVHAARGYLLQGDLNQQQIAQAASQLLADDVVERSTIAEVTDPMLSTAPAETSGANLIYIVPKQGVTDPVAASATAAIQRMGLPVSDVRTLRKYWIESASADELKTLAAKLLGNESVEDVYFGPLTLNTLSAGSDYRFDKKVVAIIDADENQLLRLSNDGGLSLDLAEMRQIQSYFRDLNREPTDVELETIAQTWSEHCSHKTLAGRIAYTDEQGTRHFENMLRETIFAATEQIWSDLGNDNWMVSVFKDNAGIVTFDDDYNVTFKVETHNRPSALEPYGGANTGIGGVIRDTLGTGLGAKPICNTDVFCFARPDFPTDQIPKGVLHPRRVMKGVVAGVRDYGNRMGIPTVNGAVYFDDRYLGNPLVYCGNVGLIPKDKCKKQPEAGDYIVSIGGRTGRDGIHGATFSSRKMDTESEVSSGGAVQIGNAITEKMVTDVLLEARDRGLYTAVTDCGAGGFSSAVGEMGEDLGAEVWLEKAPIKYDGLTYTEIWISEAQERMVFSVPERHWEEFRDLCAAEDVEATQIGRFVATGKLTLQYEGEIVGDLDMQFLHDGRPPVVREATYHPAAPTSFSFIDPNADFTAALQDILGSLNVASKEWVIRQYDHEVQGGSVLKPLVGVQNDGPGDAAVVRPVLSSRRGLVIGCGMNPYYGDLDTYHMAASAIDEAVRNCVAVGANPNQIAVLDNFCWPDTNQAEKLGSLVRAAIACQDMAIALRTPFISGKDSLHNEFQPKDENGQPVGDAIAIPPSLLISAIGQVDDVAKCISMDLKAAGNLIYQVGVTKNEMGGSHFVRVTDGATGGNVPQVDAATAKETFVRLHATIHAGLVRSCHDLSEGGLAVAIAEMAFAGGLGAVLQADDLPVEGLPENAAEQAAVRLFSESNTRFLCEVTPEHAVAFESVLSATPHAKIGEVTADERLEIFSGPSLLVEANIAELKRAWQEPLGWTSPHQQSQ